MSALGDVIYVLGVLVPLFGLAVRNYLLNLLSFALGTVAFLVFVQDMTDISFSASNFYLAFLPLGFGLVNFAYFFNWVREERI
ncbi:DUF5493 family protein [Metallosphaera sedula]|uniref:DUF5493 family protein n=1 Tax=Metallosphaera sedula TaxID=43687 RepID=UPI0020BE156D|nr:DUF5493 family protein [Metallosphaera sedula]BBL46004.1 hypothetical protein MJ1HA_0091 [Metallosphaera sedula]BBL46082.1 hypothetical protein MJ1HA_0174 [Metallosphaera sedula]